MAILPCPECKAPVSSNASRCPRCGAPPPTTPLRLALELFLALCFLCLIGACVGGCLLFF